MWQAHIGLPPGSAVGNACADALIKVLDTISYYAGGQQELVQELVLSALEKLRTAGDGATVLPLLALMRRMLDVLGAYAKETVIRRLVHEHHIIAVVVDGLSRCKMAASAAEPSSAPSADAMSGAPLVGIPAGGHVDVVKVHLSFLKYVATTARCFVEFETIKSLWQSCVVRASCRGESDEFFGWLRSAIDARLNFVNETTREVVFAQLFCLNREMGASRYGEAGLRAFHAYFVARNIRAGRLSRSYKPEDRSKPADEAVETPSPRELEGIGTLWEFALSEDETLCTEASRLLIALYTRQLSTYSSYASYSYVARLPIWTSFAERCMAELRGASEALDGTGARTRLGAVVSSLRLLAAFLDAVHDMTPTAAHKPLEYSVLPAGKKTMYVNLKNDGTGFSLSGNVYVDHDAMLGELRMALATALKSRPELVRLWASSYAADPLSADLDSVVSFTDAGIYSDAWCAVLARPASDTRGAAMPEAPSAAPAAVAVVAAAAAATIWGGSAAGWAARRGFKFADERAELLRALAENRNRECLMQLADAVDGITRDALVAAVQHQLWLVLRLLPVSKEISQPLERISADDIGTIDWDKTFGLHRGLALLQRLLIVEDLVVAHEAEWMLNFGVAGGFARLYDILVDGDEIVHDAMVGHACFAVLCRLVLEGIRSERDTVSVNAVAAVRSIMRQLSAIARAAASDECKEDAARHPAEAEGVRWGLQLLTAVISAAAREALPGVLVELQGTDDEGMEVLAVAIVLRANAESVRLAGVKGVFEFCTHAELAAAMAAGGKRDMAAALLSTMLAMVGDTYQFADSCQHFYALMAMLVAHCVTKGTIAATEACLTLVRHLRRHPSLEVTSSDNGERGPRAWVG